MFLQWYEVVLDKMDKERKYSHKELCELVKALKPDMADSSYLNR